ncbi:hypothetical protein OSB04_003297 [Centaurea solstitialis]|uniref:Reverse transcriptase domain-containing protein n=1 Tax=Centaurea solstitialis TaxID=347529 RepID=A0AA38U742_9ASTR|nr:hypothetical protein OSB04_003297 [Centaurea solstitialis]
MCIDYRKLNLATRKDHFPLPFIDQMLERLAKHSYFCYLDGYSGFLQIPVHANDQEKTTFTCPYGTFAYRRMPFGLCNAPTTFQRCMMAIFSNFIEKSMEVFMDYFSVHGSDFDECLDNLSLILKRCHEVHLVLNWEKCHFMVTEGVVLGHIVSSRGIEVDRAKIAVIEGLPPPTNVKGVRSFLGHAGFFENCPTLNRVACKRYAFFVQHAVVREILRAHPLAYAMTATADVPSIYLQQFWATATLEHRFGVFSIIGQVDESKLVVSLEDIWRILHLPAATDDGHEEFDPLISAPILFSEILALGVTEKVNGVSQVTQSMLPPLWAQMFNLVNRCLSSKTKGTDKATTPFWHIFHSIAYGRRIDIAAQIWLNITKDITGRERTRHHS